MDVKVWCAAGSGLREGSGSGKAGSGGGVGAGSGRRNVAAWYLYPSCFVLYACSAELRCYGGPTQQHDAAMST